MFTTNFFIGLGIGFFVGCVFMAIILAIVGMNRMKED